MVPRSLCVFVFSALGAFGCAMDGSGDSPSQAVASGEALFEENCAACHGADASGDGPAAEALDPKPSDLRRIAARRDGIFPEAEILRIVDGRDPVVAHGSRAMPIWGRRFGLSGTPGLTSEATSRGHVQLLIEYLKTLQIEE